MDGVKAKQLSNRSLARVAKRPEGYLQKNVSYPMHLLSAVNTCV